MLPIPDVTDLDIAFPAKVGHILPQYKDIPEEFKHDRNPWVKVASHWFFAGVKGATFHPKPGVDLRKALRAIQMCLGSFEPTHEHKEAGVAYLLSQWFDGVDGVRGVTFDRLEKS